MNDVVNRWEARQGLPHRLQSFARKVCPLGGHDSRRRRLDTIPIENVLPRRWLRHHHLWLVRKASRPALEQILRLVSAHPWSRWSRHFRCDSFSITAGPPRKSLRRRCIAVATSCMRHIAKGSRSTSTVASVYLRH